MSRFIASPLLTSPVQVVCQYLYMLYKKELDSQNLVFTEPHLKPLTSSTCAQLLDHYFIRNQRDMSFTILNMFIQFLNNQLTKFTMSQFFTVESLEAMMGEVYYKTVSAYLLRTTWLPQLRRSKPSKRTRTFSRGYNGTFLHMLKF